jgi:hypothetical protein
VVWTGTSWSNWWKWSKPMVTHRHVDSYNWNWTP